MQVSPLPCYFLPPGPQHPILKNLSLRSFLNVSDQVANPYKTTCKLLFLYILIITFSDLKLENKLFCKHSLNSLCCYFILNGL